MRVQQHATHTEPVGIVIADGGRMESTTRVSAFVWGPVPDDELREATVHVTDRSSALAVA